MREPQQEERILLQHERQEGCSEYILRSLICIEAFFLMKGLLSKRNRAGRKKI
jgi:hypothetical protein